MQHLLEIVAIEKRASWLQEDVSSIVLRLIHIRRTILYLLPRGFHQIINGLMKMSKKLALRFILTGNFFDNPRSMLLEISKMQIFATNIIIKQKASVLEYFRLVVHARRISPSDLRQISHQSHLIISLGNNM